MKLDNQTYFNSDPPSIPHASKEYVEFVALLVNIDSILIETGIEKKIISLMANHCNGMKNKDVYYKFALRCTIARKLLNLNYRSFSLRAVDSKAIQWFINRGRIEGFAGECSGMNLSKSSLSRYDKLIPAEELESIFSTLITPLASPDWESKLPGLEKPLSVRDIWVDCTCLEPNIHFPVDWVLLRDATRTLIKAIECIRRHGLLHRIKNPKSFLDKINKYCIAMTCISRKKNSKKMRKPILRKIIEIATCVENHAQRYRNLLITNRTMRTDLTEAEAQQIIDRIDNVIKNLPAAKQQATDRIIREKRVNDKDKILSLYEEDVHVIYRGKASAQSEFGNTLYIAESANGLIIDYRFYKDRAPSDCKMIEESIQRCHEAYGSISSITGDRGFHSPENIALLEKKGIKNYIANKSPDKFKESLKDPQFIAAHKRRAQTEGRIGILKNTFIGDHLHSKTYEHQRSEVAWSIFTHNIWVLGRIVRRAQISQYKQEKSA